MAVNIPRTPESIKKSLRHTMLVNLYKMLKNPDYAQFLRLIKDEIKRKETAATARKAKYEAVMAKRKADKELRDSLYDLHNNNLKKEGAALQELLDRSPYNYDEHLDTIHPSKVINVL